MVANVYSQISIRDPRIQVVVKYKTLTTGQPQCSSDPLVLSHTFCGYMPVLYLGLPVSCTCLLMSKLVKRYKDRFQQCRSVD